MKPYKLILFDADETLFRFDSFSGLQRMFSRCGIDFNENDYQHYQVINKSFWTDYQNGKITAQEIHQRFSLWADKLQVSTQSLNHDFLATMTEICEPLEGALSLLQALKGETKLGIITNGFSAFQQTRLERTGVKNYLDLLVVSEEVGVPKPHRKIFDHALSLMGHPPRDQVLMVGDTLESDILGGINAGLDTCWLNRANKLAPETITPHYQVASLMELEKLVTRSKKKDF